MGWQGGFTGVGFTREEYKKWLHGQKKPMASFIAIHATGAPYTLASVGGAARMKNLGNYYQNQQKWKGGPNGFAMGDGKWYIGTPIALMGVHSPSFNNISSAYEAEGDYRAGKRHWETDTGGKIVWDTMAWAVAEWLLWMGLEANDKYIRFHKEDTRTTHRECPGAMQKSWFITKVQKAMGKQPAPPPAPTPPKVMPIVTAKPKLKVMKPGEFKYSEDWAIPMMKKVEGLRLLAYPDPPGWSIGHGHCSTSGIKPIPYQGMTCTTAEAEVMLRADLAECCRYLNAWVKVPLDQGQVDGLCMHIFQQGPSAFRRNHVANINQKLHWTTAKNIEGQKHAKAGVMRRRKLEAERYRGNDPRSW